MVKEKCSELEKLLTENDCELDELVVEFSNGDFSSRITFKELAVKTDLRELFIHRLAWNKIKHLLTNDAMQDVLGSVFGINFPIKGHEVKTFLHTITEEMRRIIPIYSGKLPGKSLQWAIIDVRKLVKFWCQLPANQKWFEELPHEVSVIYLNYLISCINLSIGKSFSSCEW
jgi:hypothetical protein